MAASFNFDFGELLQNLLKVGINIGGQYAVSELSGGGNVVNPYRTGGLILPNQQTQSTQQTQTPVVISQAPNPLPKWFWPVLAVGGIVLVAYIIKNKK